MASDRKKGEMTAAAAAAAAERAEIEAAQKAFVPPPGYKRSIVPMTESRSCMYDYGVRVEEIEPSTEIIPSSPKRRKVNVMCRYAIISTSELSKISLPARINDLQLCTVLSHYCCCTDYTVVLHARRLPAQVHSFVDSWRRVSVCRSRNYAYGSTVLTGLTLMIASKDSHRVA